MRGPMTAPAIQALEPFFFVVVPDPPGAAIAVDAGCGMDVAGTR
jgi:hypothetical protein